VQDQKRPGELAEFAHEDLKCAVAFGRPGRWSTIDARELLPGLSDQLIAAMMCA
jgi:hypothetical protein